jgi:SPP1 gp7 family putative phage head morphogenesis protein
VAKRSPNDTNSADKKELKDKVGQDEASAGEAKPDESVDNSQDQPSDLGPDDLDSAGPQPAVKPKGSPKGMNLMEEVYTGTAESTFTESAYHPDSMRRPYNPDILVQKNQAYKIYEEMLEDDQVSVAMDIKKTLVIGSGWQIKTEEEDQMDIKKDLEIALAEQGDRPFTDMLEELCQYYEYGFVVAEKIFKNRKDGSLILRDIKARHPSTWLLHTDPHGNIERFEQRGLFVNLPKVNPDSLIHMTYRPKHQNPYGRSMLFPAYAPYITKRQIVRFYAIFLEKAASPTPVAKYDRRVPQETVTEVFDIIKKFQTRTAITIPKEFELDFLETKNTGEAYVKGIHLFNMLIGRALFIPDLMGFQGAETGGGSYALGKDQINLAYRHIYRLREVLERVVNNHIIKPICMWNWGVEENFPKFKFNELSDEDAYKQAELWIKAMQGKNWEPTIEEVNHLRQLIRFPESDELTIPQPAPILGPDGQPMQGGNGDEKGGDPGDAGSADGGDGQSKGQAPPFGKKSQGPQGKGQKAKAPGKDAQGSKEPPGDKKTLDDQPDGKKKSFSFDLGSLKGDYHKKTDFAVTDNLLRAAVARIKHDAEPIVDDIFEDLIDQIHKKKIIAKRDLARLDDIQMKYLKRLQLVFKKHFRRLYGDAQSQARVEVKQSDHAHDDKLLPPDEFLDFLDDETFKYIGDWEYGITKKAKDALVKAIKDGESLSSVVGVLDDEGRKMSDDSIERYARTKSTEVYNKGRKEYFDASGVVTAYQYAAILDDRTSDICDGLDGLIFDKDDCPIPPMHFNCRSTLVPITKFEHYEVDEKTADGEDIDQFIDDNIGKGFPKN